MDEETETQNHLSCLHFWVVTGLNSNARVLALKFLLLPWGYKHV